MSLRTRLLLVLAVLAVAGLAVADVTTYRALHTFLLDRVDQQLDSSGEALEQRLERGRGPLQLQSLGVGATVELRVGSSRQSVQVAPPGVVVAVPQIPA